MADPGQVFLAGSQEGRQRSASPFAALLGEISTKKQRRDKEDAELQKAITLLEKEHEYKIGLEREKKRLDTEALPEGQGVVKQAGLAPRATAEARPTAQALTETVGLKPKKPGKTIEIAPGEFRFQPEKPTETKTRLQIEELQRKATPEGRKAAAREEALGKAEGQALAQEKKFAAMQERNFKIAEDKLKLTYDIFDEAVKETEKMTGKKGAGRIGGTITAALGLTGTNPKVKAFEGQMIEASTAIAKIAAPSAKVGPDLIKMFGKTLPKIGFFTTSTTDEAIEQTATSMTNAFINYANTNEDKFPDGVDFNVFKEQTAEMLRQLRDRQGKAPEGVTPSGIKFKRR